MYKLKKKNPVNFFPDQVKETQVVWKDSEDQRPSHLLIRLAQVPDDTTVLNPGS